MMHLRVRMQATMVYDVLNFLHLQQLDHVLTKRHNKNFRHVRQHSAMVYFVSNRVGWQTMESILSGLGGRGDLRTLLRCG